MGFEGPQALVCPCHSLRPLSETLKQHAVEKVGGGDGHLLLGHVLANLNIALLASTSASRRVA